MSLLRGRWGGRRRRKKIISVVPIGLILHYNLCFNIDHASQIRSKSSIHCLLQSCWRRSASHAILGTKDQSIGFVSEESWWWHPGRHSWLEGAEDHGETGDTQQGALSRCDPQRSSNDHSSPEGVSWRCKKVKHVKHNDNITIDGIIKIARQMRSRSMAKALVGTVREVLDTAQSIGCEIDRRLPTHIVIETINEG